MLIKTLTNSAGDYTRALKQRRLISLALLAVGLVGYICYFLLVPDSALNAHAQGFYLGAASGLIGGALTLLIRSQYLLTHPDARKKARIKEKDEREAQITADAAKAAGLVTFFVAAAAMFVLLPYSEPAFYALFAVMFVYTVTFLIAWLSKRQ